MKAKILAASSVIRLVEFFLGTILGLWLMPFIINSLGDRWYGLWIFCGSFLGYFGLLDLGMSTTILRFIAHAQGKQDQKEINEIVTTSMLIFSVLGLLSLLIALIIARFVPVFIRNITDVVTFREIIIILGVNFAIGFPLRVFGGILKANFRYDIDSAIEVLKILVRTVLIIVSLNAGYGIVGLAYLTLGTEVAAYLARGYAVRILFKRLKISLNLINKEKVKMLFNYSALTFVAQLADQLRFNVDNLVIAAFVGLSAVTTYSIGARLITYFMYFIMSAFGMTLPVFSHYDGLGEQDNVREKYFFFTKLVGYVSLMIAGSFVLFGRVFIRRWVGEQYDQAYVVLLILLIPFVFDMMQSPGKEVLFGMSKHKYYTISNAIEGVLNLVLSIFLVRKYGIIGVALGTAVPMTIMKLFVQPVYTCRVIGISMRKFYVGLMTPIILISASYLALFWFLGSKFITAHYSSIVLCVSIECIFFIAFVYVLGFSKKEKSYFRSIFVPPAGGF